MKTFLLILVSIISLHAQGYVDEDSVLKSFPEYLLAQEEIQLRQKELTDTFELKVHAYETLINHSPGNVPQSIKNDTALYRLYIAEVENELRDAQKSIDDYSSYAMIVMENLELKWHNILRTKLTLSVAFFCKQYQINSMFDKTSLLYCPDCKDYTNELIDFIKKGN